MVTKAYKAWGMFDGEKQHRQRESFKKSYRNVFSNGDKTRIIEVLNSDVTKTNLYSIVRITCNSAEECRSEIHGQISDGIFENSRTGLIEEIPLSDVPEAIENIDIEVW